MSHERIITLTTDFGYKDPFVGEMKGVILSINPSVTLVDITHGIEPHNIEEGAFVIGSSCKYFPPGTIHIAVVDPGVGSERRAIILEADGHYFVGPDNGIFSYVMSFSQELKVIHIAEEEYMLSKDSPTFQGRDIFAPVAAWLSRVVELDRFGCVIDDFKRFEIPLPKVKGDIISGEVIYIDRFGNAITNIRKTDLQKFGEQFCVEIKGRVIQPVKNYSQAAGRGLYCLVNSSSHLEIFVNMGSASQLFDINKDEKVTVLKQI
ncbi:MAG: SAM-dependent chlorinase/fluorinase [Nitrospirae bacterium]|nr:SAM-dependent chlorinase/fluorinase [Nitrospirota bacterium]